MSGANGNGHARPDPAARRVFLAQPGYGEQTAGSARAFWRATRLPDAQVVRAYREGSLLAANFNALWCDALNVARAGRLDYFAMIHADVEPADHWLDALIDEMEVRDLDVLGVVVPIKDRHGLTSLALDRPDGDTWRPLARLTMTEVFRLPETFTSDDIGHPLLLNTGLWACRFREEWARQVHFTINDRIVTLPDGRYTAQCEPEDWFFSRLCHELGLKIGATRKVQLTHRGAAPFSNARAWGEPFDAAWIDRSPLPASTDPFVLPDIPGWLHHAEGQALAEMARGKRVLEVGSYCGLSTVCMARTAKHVVSVDPHDGRGTTAPQATWRPFIDNLARCGVTGKVTALARPFESLDLTGDGPFDLIYIDGDHSREAVESDIAHAIPLLAADGVLAFHDYDQGHPDVIAAVDALAADGGEFVSLTESLAVVRPPATIPDGDRKTWPKQPCATGTR